MASNSDLEVGFPFQLDTRGRVFDPGYEEHVRQMIELVLFTSPGERVNRPDFGCGLLELVFSPETEQETTVTRHLVQTSLQRWLGEVISVREVDIAIRDTELDIRIAYELLDHENQEQIATFELRDLPWEI